jgi:hypothetical protein
MSKDIYSVFLGFSGMETQEEFQGTLSECQDYVSNIEDADLTQSHIELCEPEFVW